MVKADAYGHGALPVARELAAAAVDGMCVATIDEALELRDGGVETPLLLLYPVPPAFALDAARRGIEATVGDEALLGELLAAVARDAGGLGAPELALHLEVETGLGRGGFATAALIEAADLIQASPGAFIAGTWTHLAAPDDPERTTAQVEAFETALAALDGAGIPAGRRHLAASGGLLVGVPAYDAVRPGLVVYGLPPEGVEATQEGNALVAALRPAMAVRARPVRVVDLPPGHGVSYGPSFVTDRASRVATLPIGYGDGWARSGSNRGQALVRGWRVPLVGTVAMDAVMADVTDVPGPPVGLDDVFTLIGRDGRDEITAADVARSRTTISWEVVTTMARRMPRVYHAAAGPMGLRTLTALEDRWPESSSGTATSATSRSTRS